MTHSKNVKTNSYCHFQSSIMDYILKNMMTHFRVTMDSRLSPGSEKEFLQSKSIERKTINIGNFLRVLNLSRRTSLREYGTSKEVTSNIFQFLNIVALIFLVVFNMASIFSFEIRERVRNQCAIDYINFYENLKQDPANQFSLLSSTRNDSCPNSSDNFDGICNFDDFSLCPWINDCTDCNKCFNFDQTTCSSCPYANNGVCENSSLCPKGTDCADCYDENYVPNILCGEMNFITFQQLPNGTYRTIKSLEEITKSFSPVAFGRFDSRIMIMVSWTVLFLFVGIGAASAFTFTDNVFSDDAPLDNILRLLLFFVKFIVFFMLGLGFNVIFSIYGKDVFAIYFLMLDYIEYGSYPDINLHSSFGESQFFFISGLFSILLFVMLVVSILFSWLFFKTCQSRFSAAFTKPVMDEKRLNDEWFPFFEKMIETFGIQVPSKDYRLFNRMAIDKAIYTLVGSLPMDDQEFDICVNIFDREVIFPETIGLFDTSKPHFFLTEFGFMQLLQALKKSHEDEFLKVVYARLHEYYPDIANTLYENKLILVSKQFEKLQRGFTTVEDSDNADGIKSAPSVRFDIPKQMKSNSKLTQLAVEPKNVKEIREIVSSKKNA